MEYYTIPPFAHLELDKNATHYLTVAQWVEQEEALLPFYKKRVAEGAKLILDNGMFEFREVYPVDDYLDMAKEIGACTIVAPDVWKNALQTSREAETFYDSLSNEDLNRWKIMGAPHGKTISEFCWCYEKLVGFLDIIGLTKGEWNDTTGWIRPYFTWMLEQENCPVELHLLGLDNVQELLFCNPDKVVSFDTSLPWKAAFQNKIITSQSTITGMFTVGEVLNEDQQAWAIRNLESIREYTAMPKANMWRKKE